MVIMNIDLDLSPMAKEYTHAHTHKGFAAGRLI